MSEQTHKGKITYWNKAFGYIKKDEIVYFFQRMNIVINEKAFQQIRIEQEVEFNIGACEGNANPQATSVWLL